MLSRPDCKDLAIEALGLQEADAALLANALTDDERAVLFAATTSPNRLGRAETILHHAAERLRAELEAEAPAVAAAPDPAPAPEPVAPEPAPADSASVAAPEPKIEGPPPAA